MFQKPLPPPLTFGLMSEPGCYSLAGWEEFERHMLLNDPLYRIVEDCYGPVQEADRLKLLIASMAHRAISQENQIARLIASYGVPVGFTAAGQPCGEVAGLATNPTPISHDH